MSLQSVRSEQEAELEVTEEAMERGLEQCEQEIRKWQANYLRSRQEFEEEAQQKVRKMQVEASQVRKSNSERCLYDFYYGC